MKEGWIKTHRKLLDNPRFRDGDWLKVWVWMLLNASHGGYDVLFRGERITLKAGQFTAGRKQIAEKTGVSENKVYRILETLKNEQQIEQQISNACSLFTITKWDDYQNNQQQNEQPANNQSTTSEQPANTNQECKEGIEGKEKKRDGFQPPTMEEANLHAAKIGLPAAEVLKFFAHYESNGWRVGKNKMKNWVSSMSGWKVRWEERRSQFVPQGSTPALNWKDSL